MRASRARRAGDVNQFVGAGRSEVPGPCLGQSRTCVHAYGASQDGHKRPIEPTGCPPKEPLPGVPGGPRERTMTTTPPRSSARAFALGSVATLRDHAGTSAGVRWTGVRVVLWMDRRRRRCPWGTSPAHVGEARRERSATRCGSHRSWEATTTARGSPGRRHGVGREEISSSRGGRRTGPGSCPCGARTLRGVWPLRRRPRHAAR